MRIFGFLYEKAIVWSKHPHAPWYLGGLSFMESSFFPIPPDVMLAPMVVAKPKNAFFLALLTTITSVLGGILGYVIGYFAIDALLPIIEQVGYLEKYHTIKDWFTKWGFWIVFLAGFSPIPYKMFTISAGAMSLALLPFIIASAISRGARFFLVAFLVAFLGQKFEQQILRYIEWLGWLAVILLTTVYILLHV